MQAISWEHIFLVKKKTWEDLLAVWNKCLFDSPNTYCLTGHWQMVLKLKESGVDSLQFNERFKGNPPEEKNGATFKNFTFSK